MKDKELTYDDFLQRLDIRDVLLDAGYRRNRRFGLRLPSFIRTDSEGRRIRGDKFVITQQGKCCFQPPRGKEYDAVSFIREHPTLFAEYRDGIAPDRLVELVCCRLLNIPVREHGEQTAQPEAVRPFDLTEYDLRRFDPQDRETQQEFYPYFRVRGIDLGTQQAFHRHFCLATKHGPDGAACTSLSFPLTRPKGDGTVVGFEERDGARMDGGGSRQVKIGETSPREGLWIASPGRTPLTEAGHVYWFMSAYDAMAYYQLHRWQHPELRQAVFVSTGGNLNGKQMRDVLELTLPARQHICFGNDLAGMDSTKKLLDEKCRVVRSVIEETPERKPYLGSIPDGTDIDSGDIELLPEPMRSGYGRFEAEWEEAMSMRSSGLCHPQDIEAQVEKMNGYYREFREELREFLGLDRAKDVSCVREQPTYPSRDWNEQLLAEQKREESADETQERERDSEEERQTRFHR